MWSSFSGSKFNLLYLDTYEMTSENEIPWEIVLNKHLSDEEMNGQINGCDCWTPLLLETH